MRSIDVKVLPGEPTDGSGHVRIHWFVRSENGAAVTPAGTVKSSIGPLKAGGVRGYLACQKGRADIGSRVVGGMIAMTLHTDEVRAATCPECLATAEAKAMLTLLEGIVPAPAYPAKEEG